jgi:outer membrane lipoprotein carrier protein
VRFILFLLFVVSSISSVTAQTTPQAAPIVRALEARYRDVKSLKALFLQTFRDSRSGMQVESGTVYFSKPGRMRWEYESPEQKLFIADGKNVWFYVPADKMVTRAPMKESADWRTPLALLTGNVRLSRLCDQISISSVPPSNSAYVVLECLPRGAERSAERQPPDAGAEGSLLSSTESFERVLLEVRPDTGHLAALRIHQPGGVQLEFRFGEWQENVSVASSLFRFDVPPGIAVLDEETVQP